MEIYELVSLKSGLHSLRSLNHRETFHPGIGPQAEAHLLHVQQQRLIARSRETDTEFVIWDVGFGAAANAVAAIRALESIDTPVEIHSFDLTTSAIEFALLHPQELGYLEGYSDLIRDLILHGQVQIKKNLVWKFHLGDFAAAMKKPELPSPHSIFYDPYSPARNPEMWTLEHFTDLRRTLSERPCLLSNYTRSTAMRVALLLAGFFVGKGCSIHEKLETTLASNHLHLLEEPLERSWLDRVRRSGNAAPLRTGTYSLSPISPQDFRRLEACPQFN